MNDNSPNYRVAASQLRAFIERIEKLDEERAAITEQRREVLSEAKANGYDTKALNAIIALRKKDPQIVSEEEAVLQLYKDVLGMDGTDG